jgi:hypothetical protein
VNEHYLNGMNVAIASIAAGQLFKQQRWFLGLLAASAMGFWAYQEVALNRKENA